MMIWRQSVHRGPKAVPSRPAGCVCAALPVIYRCTGPAGHMPRTFKIVLIKPSHYDVDGYVIQWMRSTIPSNSLASVYGLLSDCATDKALGPDVDITIEAFDECNTVVNIKHLIREMRGQKGFLGLIGVQSNQFPR